MTNDEFMLRHGFGEDDFNTIRDLCVMFGAPIQRIWSHNEAVEAVQQSKLSQQVHANVKSPGLLYAAMQFVPGPTESRRSGRPQVIEQPAQERGKTKKRVSQVQQDVFIGW